MYDGWYIAVIQNRLVVFHWMYLLHNPALCTDSNLLPAETDLRIDNGLGTFVPLLLASDAP